ncbi:hypothetical protein [Bacillus pumilus]|uniref:hypothetical protein n=1 Tax=Bacillus pumilus TaxID=1408 RepID=UPI002281761B|nr:hypothetical protein [Bacillus pumilus]MCY7500212.1 hypothetical protein [Bacillus pumilus]MCY7528464.1 hypothetical protein [Bacillus pumilus]MED4490021.1 hypothetical protein [Bacillus pumilus]
MDFIDRAKKEIKENWFKNHVAEIKGEEGLQVIYWGKSGTNMYRTKYVLSGNNIFISGDIGEAVYSLTCSATLDNIKDFNLDYFTGKLEAFCEDRWNFDQTLAKKELREYWDEYEINEQYDDAREIYKGIISAIDESNSLDAYRAWLMPVYQNTSVDSDTMEYVWDFGKRMPYRLIGYWVGLQMVIEQLSSKEGKTA